jgi:sugar fermentation stimulation protein A
MQYKNIQKGIFIDRPNRFIAYVEIDGSTEVCHVKNTGRCKEILRPGTLVFLEKAQNPNRKTNYDLISAYKGDRLINIDSQAPNRVFLEWIRAGNLFGKDAVIQPESRYSTSRFDFYVAGAKNAYIEVKGVTLEQDGVALFPDAPTERGVKHLIELCHCVRQGYEAYVVFVIQMENVKYFSPHKKMHPAFADALKRAEAAGVKILALDCTITENSIVAKDFVKVKL